jgi:hypothetical protein
MVSLLTGCHLREAIAWLQRMGVPVRPFKKEFEREIYLAGNEKDRPDLEIEMPVIVITDDGKLDDQLTRLMHRLSTEYRSITEIDYGDPLNLSRRLGELLGCDYLQMASRYQPTIDPAIVTVIDYCQGAKLTVPPELRGFFPITKPDEIETVRSSSKLILLLVDSETDFDDLREAVDELLNREWTGLPLRKGGNWLLRGDQLEMVPHLLDSTASKDQGESLPPIKRRDDARVRDPVGSIYDGLESFLSSDSIKESRSIHFLFGNSQVLPFLLNCLLTLLMNGCQPVIFVYDTGTLRALIGYPVALVKMFDDESATHPTTFLKMVFQKLVITQALLAADKVVVYHDADTVVHQNRFDRLVDFLLSSPFDVLVQSSPTSFFCTGIYLVKPTAATVERFRSFPKQRRHFKGGDQHYFNSLIAPYLEVFRLPPWSYPVGRFLKRSHQWLRPVVSHYNCFESGEQKKHFLKMSGLDLYQHFSAHTFHFLLSNPKNLRSFQTLFRVLDRLRLPIAFHLKNCSDKIAIITDQTKYLFEGVPTVVPRDFPGNSSSMVRFDPCSETCSDLLFLLRLKM